MKRMRKIMGKLMNKRLCEKQKREEEPSRINFVIFKISPCMTYIVCTLCERPNHAEYIFCPIKTQMILLGLPLKIAI